MMKIKVKSKYSISFCLQSWLKLIDLAKDKVEIITQWGIYNSTGYGLKFYQRLEEGNFWKNIFRYVNQENSKRQKLL